MDIILKIALAFLPIIIFGFIVYKSDKEREPLLLVFSLFILGFFACIAVYFINILLNLHFEDFFLRINTANASIVDLLIKDFCIVAFIEELFKWIILMIFGFKSKNYNYTYDITVYSVFVSLGFAFFENLLYVFRFGTSTAFIRLFLGVPGHVCFAVLSAYFLNLARITKHKSHRIKYLIYSLLIPIIIHGVYDFTLEFEDNTLGPIFTVIFLVFVSVLYAISLANVKLTIDGDKKIV